MSIEEKARAYDEALERAKQAKDIELAEYIFPELRESEDERIRKALIDGVSQIRCKGNVTREQMIAYLERQKYNRMKPIYDARESFESALEKAWNDYHNGYENVDKLEDDYVECAHAKGFREGYLFGIEKQKEHSMSAEEVLTRAGLKPYKDGNQWCILAGDNIQEGICGFGDTIDEALYQFLMEVLEKQKEQSLRDFIDDFPYSDQKEQKPIEDVVKDITKNKESAIKFLKSTGIMDDNGELAKIYRSEQKPAEWNEEDILNLDRIVGLLNSLKQYVRENTAMSQQYKEAVFKRIEQEYSFLKSLPERFNLQPKQKWNEEDEAHRNFILESLEDQIRFCKKDAEGAYYAKQIRTAQNWLKSFPPSWKPSEHQMNILKAVKEYVGRGSGYWGEALGSLIEDLEKL